MPGFFILFPMEFGHCPWMTIAPLGDSALVVTLGSDMDEATILRVRLMTAAIQAGRFAGIVDVVPAYASITVFYEIASSGSTFERPYDRIFRVLSECAQILEDKGPELTRERETGKRLGRLVTIPVCYSEEFGPDLSEVAQHCGLSVAEVVALHSGATYEVHAVGFTPGFPYLGGLPDRLHVPRKSTPRLTVPAGSVGIGGQQTGIYSQKSPGGWQLIGRTPQTLFSVKTEPPALLRVGDCLRFSAIAREEFETWK